MKTRIISAAFGIGFLFLILSFYNTYIYNCAVALICFLMVYEVFKATKVLEKSVFAFVVCELFSVVCAFCKISKLKNLSELYLIGYGAIFLFMLFRTRGLLKIENLIFTFSFSAFLIFSMNLLLEIRDKMYPHGLYYTLLLCSIAWVCDSGAYFIGLKFGRVKLAPTISPNKTVEGAVGGVLFDIVIIMLFSFFYFKFFNSCSVNWVSLFVVVIVGSFCAIVGDLSLSVVKRSYKIKDFGKIIQGHGGMLDRFDSWIFVSIVVYPIILKYPIILD